MYVEVYIPREMHFFFNAIFLACVNVFLTKLKKSTTRSCQCKCKCQCQCKFYKCTKSLALGKVSFHIKEH